MSFLQFITVLQHHIQYVLNDSSRQRKYPRMDNEQMWFNKTVEDSLFFWQFLEINYITQEILDCIGIE